MVKLSRWTESDVIAEADETTPKDPITLNKNLSQQEFIEDFSQNFGRYSTFKVKKVKMMNDPFLVTVVDDFLVDKSIIPNLVNEMETMEWTRKQMDLYEFYQTTDLVNIQSQYLSLFYNFLNTDVKNWMQQLTGMKFQKISASCSMYNAGDFLLTHDDLLSDRLIAFVFYLSPWKNKEKWTEAMGGELDLFSTDRDGQPQFPVKMKILPANNQFVFFKVEKKSYHQVAEVLTKDYPRLTINGWFHGYKNNVDFDSDAVKVKIPNISIFATPENLDMNLSDFIQKVYLKDKIKFSIQKQIEEKSETSLEQFLVDDFHSKVFQELQDGKLNWITKGPTNQQNYEILDSAKLPGNSKLKSLVDFMKSKVLFKLLHEYTELDFAGLNAKKPKCSVEIQRLKGGCYTLIGDPSTYSHDALDLTLYFGNNESIGTVTYLNPEEDDQGDSDSELEVDPVILTIYPENNFLDIVYRSQGTAKFTKYCSKSSFMQSEFNYILSCSYKE